MSATIRDQASQAAGGIRALRYLAARGDAQAAADLLAVATEAAGHIHALAARPPGDPVRIILDQLAGSATNWPVNIPAIEELRPASFSNVPATLGISLPYRAKKGATKHRDFIEGPPSLAIDAFRDMEGIRVKSVPGDMDALREIWRLLPATMKKNWRTLAVMLPPLSTSPKVITAWKEAGTRWAEDQCQGQWKTFPWPDEVIIRANQPTNSRKRGIETAVKEYLGKGFTSLAHLPLIRGE